MTGVSRVRSPFHVPYNPRHRQYYQDTSRERDRHSKDGCLSAVRHLCHPATTLPPPVTINKLTSKVPVPYETSPGRSRQLTRMQHAAKQPNPAQQAPVDAPVSAIGDAARATKEHHPSIFVLVQAEVTGICTWTVPHLQANPAAKLKPEALRGVLLALFGWLG